MRRSGWAVAAQDVRAVRDGLVRRVHTVRRKPGRPFPLRPFSLRPFPLRPFPLRPFPLRPLLLRRRSRST